MAAIARAARTGARWPASGAGSQTWAIEPSTRASSRTVCRVSLQLAPRPPYSRGMISDNRPPAAQRVALGSGAAGDVALGGVLGEIGGQAPGNLQRRLRLGRVLFTGRFSSGPGCSSAARTGSTSLAIISPNGGQVGQPTAGQAGVGFGQQREDQFGEAVGLFQVRIAGEDEAVDAARRTPRSAPPPAADRRPARCRRRRAPGRPRPRGSAGSPGDRGGRRAARPCVAGLRSRNGRRTLRGGDGLVGDVLDQPRGAQASSAVSRTITCRRMPNFTVCPWRAARWRTSAIFAATPATARPGQVDVHLFAGQFVGGPRTAEVQRRIRPCSGG